MYMLHTNDWLHWNQKLFTLQDNSKNLCKLNNSSCWGWFLLLSHHYDFYYNYYYAASLHTSKYFPWELTWPDTTTIKDLNWHFSADNCKEKQMHASWSFLVGRSILEKKCYLYELYVPECLQDPNCVHSMLSWCCCSDRIQTDPYQAHLHKLL